MKRTKKWTFKIVFVMILALSSLILVKFGTTKNKIPNELYTVFLDGNKIGTVKSGEEFNSYINKQEEKLKAKYEVDTIYAPKGVEIKKVITY